MPLKVLYAVVGMLLLALAPVPYGYYSLLRLITTALFAWAVVESHRRGEENLPWAFVALTLLFNPFINIHFSRGVWNVIDVCAAIFLLMVKSKITAPKPVESLHGK
jgi:hypothetical protein